MSSIGFIGAGNMAQALINGIIESGKFAPADVMVSDISGDRLVWLAKEYGALLMLDTVSSLGGIKVKVDKWGVDASFSCSQKCIGCPPGLSPFTFSNRALETIEKRKSPIRSWYLDVSLLKKYWGKDLWGNIWVGDKDQKQERQSAVPPM